MEKETVCTINGYSDDMLDLMNNRDACTRSALPWAVIVVAIQTMCKTEARVHATLPFVLWIRRRSSPVPCPYSASARQQSASSLGMTVHTIAGWRSVPDASGHLLPKPRY